MRRTIVFQPVARVSGQGVLLFDLPVHLAGLPLTYTFAQGVALITIEPKVFGESSSAGGGVFVEDIDGLFGVETCVDRFGFGFDFGFDFGFGF